MLLKIGFVEVSRTCCDMYISKSVSVYRESFERVLRSCCVSCVMVDRQLHRERLDQVCCICHSDDVGVPITPCCHKPAHYECCSAPIHLHSELRNVCMILDLDGYRISDQPFIVREMGCCDLQGQAASILFTGSINYKDLPAKDKRTVNYVYHRVHGLPFNAKPREKALRIHT